MEYKFKDLLVNVFSYDDYFLVILYRRFYLYLDLLTFERTKLRLQQLNGCRSWFFWRNWIL